MLDTSSLTRKNQEYVKIVSHFLTEEGKTSTEVDTIIQDLIPELQALETKGVTARSVLGAPTVWASQFTEKAVIETSKVSVEKNTNPWLMWLNTSLFFLGILAIVNGFIANFPSNASRPQTGVLSLLSMGFFGGAAMYAIYYFIYRHSGKPKSERPGFWKSFGGLLLAFFIWIVAVSAITYVPASINPVLPPIVAIIIGAVVLALAFWMKRKYNIESTLASYQPKQ
jgi:uncharacterized membrane-anchored protein